MRYKHSKTSPAPTVRIWENFWFCSGWNTWNPINGYSKTQILTTGLQSSEPEVNWFSRRTPEISERCIRSCRSSDHWAIHICQNASPPEEINQPGAFLEWHIWKDCVTSSTSAWTWSTLKRNQTPIASLDIQNEILTTLSTICCSKCENCLLSSKSLECENLKSISGKSLLFSFTHACWYNADVQRNQQLHPRQSRSTSSLIPWKIGETTTVTTKHKPQKLVFKPHQSQVFRFCWTTPKIGMRRLRSSSRRDELSIDLRPKTNTSKVWLVKHSLWLAQLKENEE